MQVERSDRVVLGHVEQIDPHQLAHRHFDREPREEAGHPVPGVDGVGSSILRIPAVQHEDRPRGQAGRGSMGSTISVPNRPRDMCTARGGVWQWYGCTPGRACLDLVGLLAARRDGLPTVVGNGMAAMEVEIVWDVRLVREPDRQQVALGGADDGPGDGSVERPGIDEQITADFDSLVERPLCRSPDCQRWAGGGNVNPSNASAAISSGADGTVAVRAVVGVRDRLVFAAESR